MQTGRENKDSMEKDWNSWNSGSNQNKKKEYGFFYMIIVLTTMLPLACRYIMQGGIIDEWVVRIQEVKLFPDMETILSTGSRMNALNSNLWFLPSAVLFAATKKLVWSYMLQMVFLQVGTLFTSYIMFHEIFSGSFDFMDMEEKRSILFGVLLYMTCPYRIYCCYDRADLFQAAAWMLLPVYIWAVIKVTENGKWIYIFLTAFSLAGIGYADNIYFLIVTGISLLVVIIANNWKLLFALAGGCILFFPGLFRLVQYFCTDRYDELGFSLQSIMDRGYTIGEYFGFYVYSEGKPGMGFGIFFGLLTGLWLIFVAEKWKKSTISKLFFWLAIIMFLLSLKYFPWDYVQRLGSWSLKLVGLIGTPAIFGGLAQLLFCVPAACASGKIGKAENRYIAVGMTMLIALSSLGLCAYYCDMLIYQRIPFQ